MYETHFNLTDKPFKLSPDPKFFFESPHHQRAFAYLQYGLSQGEGFIVVTGPIGTGKTTLARTLLSSIDNNIVAAQIATTRLTPDELVSLVASQFNIEVEGYSKSEILRRFELFLLQLHSQGKRALLVVDEAQNLPAETVEELRMLSNFQLDDKPLIQSFLLGQEELRPIIALPQMEQFRQRIIASSHLKAFDEQQVKDYIFHRLKKVGWDEFPKLDDNIFTLITDYTLGIPRKINIFVDRLFLYAYLEEIDSIQVTDVNVVIEELSEELSGSLAKDEEQTVTNSNAAVTDVLPVTQQLLSDNHLIEPDQIMKTLMEVSDVLDNDIQRKIRVIRQLDKFIRIKSKQVEQLDKN
ncbi:MAG: AAA family ATPase [Aliivibrio sp.]|uniref:XrtA/PEP-CTERM system-associated ATPase n=1 Tax=Aliivibrio sp. TaxID=1872443 RepID=UPI001A365FCF|nr:AAA family ATPase [Aliivibrio sp.]